MSLLKTQGPTITELDARVSRLTMRPGVGTSTCANFMFQLKGEDPSAAMASILLDRLNGPRPNFMRGGDKVLSGLYGAPAGMLDTQ